MNSKYSGEQVETLLDRVASLGDSNTDQKEPLDSFKIGEIRYNSNAKNPFGDDYILCLGQEVPIDKYPNAAMALSISSEFKNAKRVSVPDMSEGNMVDLGSNELFSINGELLGKIRMMSSYPPGITPDGGDMTAEVMMEMINNAVMCLDVSEDGINWVEKYKFQKQEQGTCVAMSIDILNGELVIFCKLCYYDENAEPIVGGNKIFRTKDFLNFQDWTESDLTFPNQPNNDYAFIQTAYGNGVYLTYVRTNDNMINFFQSQNLIDWTPPTEDFSEWSPIDTSNGTPSLSVHFCGGNFILQIGYTFISPYPHLLLSNGVGGVGTDNNMIDDTILDIKCIDTGFIDVEYFAITDKNAFTITKNSDGYWESAKIELPKDITDISSVKNLGNGMNFFVFSRYSNKYFVFPGVNSSKTIAIDGNNTQQGANFIGIYQVKNKLYIKDIAQGDNTANIVLDLQAVTPNLVEAFGSFGVFPYIKVN